MSRRVRRVRHVRTVERERPADVRGLTEPEPVRRFALVIDGAPPAKRRPRFGRGRTFTDAATRLDAARVLGAWLAAGSPRLADGPVALDVRVRLARPAAHLRRDGALSAEGLRAGRVWARRRPDLDNVVKLVCDALNGAAWRDDADIVHVTMDRRWCLSGEVAGIQVAAWVLDDAEAPAC